MDPAGRWVGGAPALVLLPRRTSHVLLLSPRQISFPTPFFPVHVRCTYHIQFLTLPRSSHTAHAVPLCRAGPFLLSSAQQVHAMRGFLEARYERFAFVFDIVSSSAQPPALDLPAGPSAALRPQQQQAQQAQRSPTKKEQREAAKAEKQSSGEARDRLQNCLEWQHAIEGAPGRRCRTFCGPLTHAFHNVIFFFSFPTGVGMCHGS